MTRIQVIEYNTNYFLCSLVSMLSWEKYTQYLNVNAMSVMIKSEEIESKQIHLHRTLNKPAKQLYESTLY